MDQEYQYDVLILGTGAAGLTLALSLSSDIKIALLSKTSLTEASTYYAQGGVAAVLSEQDTFENHIKDTINAGAGLCDETAVRFTVEHSQQAINWLIDQGVPFTKEEHKDNTYHLGQEGGHSQRRIIHVADATGHAISNTLIDHVIKKNNIDIFDNHIAVDLITKQKLGLNGNDCIGAYILNLITDHVDLFKSKCVVLATGGASKVYLYTSNPDCSTGDGIAMAWRTGCRIANMEFNQFHPTCLYHPHAKSFLVTEALRGEGAKLLLPNGQIFMEKFDPRAELAPRDIVARAIDYEMKRLGCDCLFLDISFKPANFILEHFPTVHQRCLEFGIDITQQPIPIVPAAHYTCGGIMTNLQGQTDIPNLYAIGETAFTGLHGANRMASNSLLECFVFAQAAANDITNKLKTNHPDIAIPAWDDSQVTDSDEDIVINHNWEELRRFMWDYVGIVRTNKRLQRAKHRIDLLQQEIAEYYSNYKISNDLLELRNLAVVAELIINSALARKESRGLHYTLDHANTLDKPCNTIMTPK